MNKETIPEIEIDDEFAEIIKREFSANATKVLGETAISKIEPFGHQFMGDIIETQSDPKATTPGGLTSTISNGRASLDDPSSSDVD
jgi:hypothetical protein